MDYKEGKHIIEIKSDECYSIAYCLEKCVRENIIGHWVNHPNSDWRKNEEPVMRLMEDFYRMSHSPRESKYAIERLENVYKEVVKK